MVGDVAFRGLTLWHPWFSLGTRFFLHASLASEADLGQHLEGHRELQQGLRLRRALACQVLLRRQTRRTVGRFLVGLAFLSTGVGVCVIPASVLPQAVLGVRAGRAVP